jgi:D-xylose reductase
MSSPDGVPQIIEDPVPVRETWEAMEELVSLGLVRNIGLSNYNIQSIRDILSYAKVKPAVLQVELHPYNTQENLVKYCKEKGIAMTGFSTFGASAYQELGMTTEKDFVLNNEVVKTIASETGKTAA